MARKLLERGVLVGVLAFTGCAADSSVVTSHTTIGKTPVASGIFAVPPGRGLYTGDAAFACAGQVIVINDTLRVEVTDEKGNQIPGKAPVVIMGRRSGVTIASGNKNPIYCEKITGQQNAVRDVESELPKGTTFVLFDFTRETSTPSTQ